MICFVILHYIVEEETIRCVERLLQISGEKEIIIVDNGSQNGSGKRLKVYYEDVPNITVLLNPENMGFAKGNNIGYRYAKEHFAPDYMVILNNDIEILQKEFGLLIDRIYRQKKFAVLGPDVYAATLRMHQSPKSLTSIGEEELKRIHADYQKRCSSKVMVPLRCMLKQIGSVKRFVYQKRLNAHQIDYGKSYENVPLHGSCLIFSREYMDRMEDAFYPGTFLYFESEILDYLCRKNHLLELYEPSIQVVHHENSSTKAAYHSALKRVRFMNQCIMDSTERFLELLEQNS